MDPAGLFGTLVIGGLIAWLIANAAKKRGFSFAKYFWVSFLLGILGWIIAIIMWQVDSSKKKKTTRAANSPGAGATPANLKPQVGKPTYGPVVDNDR